MKWVLGVLAVLVLVLGAGLYETHQQLTDLQGRLDRQVADVKQLRQASYDTATALNNDRQNLANCVNQDYRILAFPLPFTRPPIHTC